MRGGAVDRSIDVALSWAGWVSAVFALMLFVTHLDSWESWPWILLIGGTGVAGISRGRALRPVNRGVSSLPLGAALACLANVEYPRRCRRAMWFFGGASAISVAVGVAVGDLIGGLVIPWLLLTLTVGPVVYDPRIFGSVMAQRELCVGAEGLRYGDKYRVPWSSVTDVAVRQPGDRVVIVAPGWRPGGLLKRLEVLRGLPLSDFDRRWHENEGLIAALRDHLPQVDFDGLPKRRR